MVMIPLYRAALTECAEGDKWNRERLKQIDLRWHDLRHEGACRLLNDGVDVRVIQLMLGHASLQQTQRHLNVTDDELRKGLQVSWQKRRLKLVVGGDPTGGESATVEPAADE